jgi:hypothetical protein
MAGFRKSCRYQTSVKADVRISIKEYRRHKDLKNCETEKAGGLRKVQFTDGW